MSTTMHGVPFEKHEVVRVGLIGCGNRGSFLLGELLAVPGVQVVAVTDARESAATTAAARVQAAGQPLPQIFFGAGGWRRVIDAPIDLAYIATPWDTHTPYAVAAMEAGRHAAVEVPAATTLEECWQLVETSERTRRHCVMLENCCYDEIEMSVKRMVRAGLLGTPLLHHLKTTWLNGRPFIF